METLKLDLDIVDFRKVSDIVSKRCGAVFGILKIKPVNVRVYSTRRGYHIYIDIDGEFSSFDICFLQMAIGSDYKRETFNFMRFKDHTDKKWNILFSKKQDENGNIVNNEQAESVLSSALWKMIREKMC